MIAHNIAKAHGLHDFLQVEIMICLLLFCNDWYYIYEQTANTLFPSMVGEYR